MHEASPADDVVRSRLRAVLAGTAAQPRPPDPDPVAAYQWEVVDDAGAPATTLSGAGAFTPPARLRAFDPGRRGVRALGAVAVLVLVIAAVLAWRARPRVEPVEPPPVPAFRDTAEVVVAARPSAAAELIVAVAGRVARPGVVHLPPGARVGDAIEAAGGARPGVDIALLNPARKVVDGELILVGVSAPPGAAAPTGGAAPPGGAAAGPVALNTATLADLDRLPGVGPVLAQRILAARDAQGGFRSVSDLRKVDGIGDSRFEQLKDLVTL